MTLCLWTVVRSTSQATPQVIALIIACALPIALLINSAFCECFGSEWMLREEQSTIYSSNHSRQERAFHQRRKYNNNYWHTHACTRAHIHFDVSLPVWLPVTAFHSSRTSPGQVYPGRKWRGRWCRRETGQSEPSRTQSSWFLRLLCHSCSSPAEGALSRSRSRAKSLRQPAAACGSLARPCCIQSECCSGRRRGSPERSARRYLRKTEKWRHESGQLWLIQLNRTLKGVLWSFWPQGAK